MREKCLVHRIHEIAKSNPDKAALVAGEHRVTYGALWRNVGAASALLSASGVGPGDRVVLAATSSPAFVYAYLGAHWIGAVVVPVDPQLPRVKLDELLSRVEARAVFVGKEIDEFLGATGFYEGESRARATEPADILFTTGTTAKPKGVVLSHANILAAATHINAFIGNNADDVEVVPLPLSHSFGLGRMRCVLLAGGTLVLVDGFAVPARIFRALENEKATGFSAVPAGFAFLFKLSGDKLGEHASRLRYVEIGSAPMPREQKERLMRLLPNTRLCMHYGLTEASRSAFIEFHSDRDSLESVGRASPGVEIRIEGDEIYVRGPHVMMEYWKAAPESVSALREGWLRTGDLGAIDGRGYVTLKGRQSEVINVGGRKVVPLEVEEQLSLHPAVADCACVGVIDPQGVSGQVCKAFLVEKAAGGQRPSDRELVEWLRARLESYKIPMLMEWVAEIPRTSSGKIQRQHLVKNDA